ncbi:MAG: PAS domain S-box protein [Spirochaetaceae bacterium]
MITSWSIIFILYIKRIIKKTISDRLVFILVIILSLDAFRSLFESSYFGIWFTSLSGIINIKYYNLLSQPELVFIPKILNLIVAILTIFIIIRKWIPEETNRVKNFEHKNNLNDLILSKIPVSVLITDKNGVIEYVNKQFCSLTGYDEKEIIGKDTNILKSDLTPKSTYEEMWSTIEHGNEWFGYFTNKKKNGEIYYESARIKPLIDSENNITSYLAIKEDITKQHNIELEKNMLIEAIEQLSASVEILDTTGKITYVNNTFLSNTGFDRECVLGTYSKEFLDENKEQNNMLIDILLSGESYNLSNIVSKNTRGFIVEDVIISPVLNNLGKIINFTTIRKNVTDNFNISNEKKELSDQINQMQRLESLGQLVGGVAHDFNNILTGITSSVELILLNPNEIKSKHQKYINIIKTSSIRAVDLTKQLLKFSKNNVNELKPLKLKMVLNETVNLLKQTIDKSISINLYNNFSNDHILGNYSTLQSVLLNIGINASHAISGEGIIKYNISNIFLSNKIILNNNLNVKPGEYCLIDITDTGSGISKDNIGKIFEPFFTTKPEDIGTGLGLSSSQRIIQDHDGCITVNSEIGQGAQFHIYLPVIKSKEKLVSIIKDDNIIGSGNILFVDDEDINRVLGKELLESIGYTVAIASNGLEALELYSSHTETYDLILLDMMMPGLSGEEVFHKLKEINPSCNIVIISGYIHEKNISKLKEKGLSGVIKKPYTINQLGLLIKEII